MTFNGIPYKNKVLDDLPRSYYTELARYPESLRTTAQNRYGLCATKIKKSHPTLGANEIQEKYLSCYWKHYLDTLSRVVYFLADLAEKASSSSTKELKTNLCYGVYCSGDDWFASTPIIVDEAKFNAYSDAVDYVKTELTSKGWSASCTTTNIIEYHSIDEEPNPEFHKYVEMSILFKCSFRVNEGL